MSANETNTIADTAIDEEGDLVESLEAATDPRAGEAVSVDTVSVLVAKIHIPAVTAVAPVLRPDKVIVKAPIGIGATAVVIVILFPENADVAVRVATEEEPAALAVGAAVVSNQPVGNQKLMVPAAGTAVVAVNLITSEVEAAASVVAEGVAVKAVACFPRPPDSALGDGAISVSV